MKRLVAMILVAVMAVCMFAACGDKGIIGKWETEYLGVTISMEFKDEEKVVMGMSGDYSEGFYKLEDDVVYFSEDGENWDGDTMQIKSLSGNKMEAELQGMAGLTLTFKRK